MAVPEVSAVFENVRKIDGIVVNGRLDAITSSRKLICYRHTEARFRFLHSELYGYDEPLDH